ncbi:uncharacterized protein VTP21DRAFT_10746 [Calcarisporiella thermophila]|uniref:uncharacterized protein n=1 Tax=Calcarisporiella thermophila TaxID=911321 RepID=UPI0037435FCF
MPPPAYSDPNFDPYTLRIPELKEILSSHGIKFSSRSRKDDLIELFKTNIQRFSETTVEKNILGERNRVKSVNNKKAKVSQDGFVVPLPPAKQKLRQSRAGGDQENIPPESEESDSGGHGFAKGSRRFGHRMSEPLSFEMPDYEGRRMPLFSETPRTLNYHRLEPGFNKNSPMTEMRSRQLSRARSRSRSRSQSRSRRASSVDPTAFSSPVSKYPSLPNPPLSPALKTQRRQSQKQKTVVSEEVDWSLGMVVLLAVIACGLAWFFIELPVGTCHNIYGWRWCTPCPPHATCSDGKIVSCDPEFELNASVYSGTRCVPATPEQARIQAMADVILEEIQYDSARRQCQDSGAVAEEPRTGLEVAALRKEMERTFEMGEYFDAVWQPALREVAQRDNVEFFEKKRGDLAVRMENPRLPIGCLAKLKAKGLMELGRAQARELIRWVWGECECALKAAA